MMLPKRRESSIHLVAKNDELSVRVTALASLTATPAEDDAEYTEVYRELVGRIAEEASRSNYDGLYELCQYFQQGVSSLLTDGSLGESAHSLLSQWPGLVQQYLDTPADSAIVETLVRHLMTPELQLSLSEGDAAVLSMMLDDNYSLSKDDLELTIDDEPVDGIQEQVTIQAIDETLPNTIANEQPGHIELNDEFFLSLRRQIVLIQTPLNRLFASIITFYVGDGGVETAREYRTAVDAYETFLKRFGESADEAGLFGLSRITELVCDNLELMAAPGSVPSIEMMELLNDFVSHTCDYLNAHNISEPRYELMDCMHADGWPKPLSSAEVQEILDLLQLEDPVSDTCDITGKHDASHEIDTNSGAPSATADLVSLELPEDVEEDLFEIMMEELPELTGEFSGAVQNLISGGTLEDLKVAQRMAHTLKGAGNTIGIKGVANLTHNMEDILIKFSEQGVLPTKELSMTMMRVVDCLDGMGEALNGNSAPPEDAVAVLQEVLDWKHRIEKEGLPKAGNEIEDVDANEASGQMDSLSSVPLSGISEALQDSMLAMPALQTETSPVRRRKRNQDSSSTVRVPANLIDNLLRLAGEATVMTGLMQERVRRTIGRIQDLQGEFNRMYSLGEKLERLVDIKDFSNPVQGTNHLSEFDSLEMDQYSELHTYSRMLAETANDSQVLGRQVKQELAGLQDMLVGQDLLNRENQDAVMDVCMVPARSIIPKLQRSVRQTARQTGKQVRLVVIGEDTQMDGDVLIELADPLMHILRNAIDHGVESADKRQQTGKNEEGTIQLEFLREGTHVLVRCHDDGAGIDFGAVQRKAVSLGILQAGEEVSQDELKRILLMANFSTREEVTQTSGRGVGMDAVYAKIVEMGGSLSLESEPGVGTMFELRVPLTLISSHALLVRQGPSLLAISDRGVLQILYGQDGELIEEGGNVYYKLGEEQYPARFLESIMELPPDRRDSDRSKRPVFLVQDEMGISAVIVGEVLESLNIVIKDFGYYVPNPVGIAGAAILGDGSIKPVIDLPDLLRHARAVNAPMIMVPERSVASKPERAMVMVVDDSRSARYMLTKVIEAAGYIVRSAHDGLEAFNLLEKRPADIVLTDMEMPRMNGIELTEQIRMSSKLEHLPVIMITSRSTQKHREEAKTSGVTDYFTKPFDEKALVTAVEALLEKSSAPDKAVICSTSQ